MPPSGCIDAMPPLHLSVALCTWNRCELLARTLDQMTRLAIPPDVTWELIVVNNRCTDATDAVVESFSARLPIRSGWDSVPGAAHARNTALSLASGEFILWTDDDILVDEDWLEAYVRAFRRWPDADIFGGPIEPAFEGEPPAWIRQAMHRIGPVYGLQTLGEQPVPLTAERIGDGPYGGNMAVRRSAQLRFKFRTELGPRHGRYAIGEETELLRQMLLAGHAGWWTPEPRVQHWVPVGSQNVEYVRRWMEGSGRYIALSPEKGAGLARNRPYRLYARMLRHEIAYRALRYVSPPEVWIRALSRASRARGQLLASLSAAEGSARDA
jgi:glucosyl-dolichyl phosphate glucuronosyltransferase